jgi:hypothetical protein
MDGIIIVGSILLAFGAMALVPGLFAALPFVLFGGMLVGWVPFAAAFLILADGDPRPRRRWRRWASPSLSSGLAALW